MKVDFSRFNLIKILNLEQTEKTSILVVSTGIFLILNFLISGVSARIDLSPGKAYTLSQSSKKIVEKLDDKVNIKVFISSDIPLRLIPLRTDVLDLINEYKNASYGKISITLMDPKKDQNAQKEVQDLGIPELRFSQIEKDKFAVSATYFGIAVFYGDKKEVIPQATSMESLEYDITSSIYKLTQKKLTKIGILGQSSFINPQEDDLGLIKKILAQQYEIENLNTTSDDAIIKPDSLKTLLVFDDYEKKYSKDEKEGLTKYLKAGGSAIFMFDGVYLSPEMTAVPATHNLFDFFKNYGITLNKDFVLSTSAEVANFTTGQLSFLTPYPFWVKTTNFSNQDPRFSNISSLSFAWVSSIKKSSKPNIETNVLVSSEKNSWVQNQEEIILDPQKIPQPEENKLSQKNLVVEAKMPQGGQFVLISSSKFVRQQFIEGRPENLGLLINLVNNYASGGALSGIRSRTISVRPIKEYPEGTADLIKYLNIFAFPGLFGLLGLMKLVKRR